MVDAVEAAAGGHPIDVVIDIVAGPLINDLLRVPRPEGRYATCGAIAGPVVELNLRTMYLKHLQLDGSSEGARADFWRLVRYIEDGKLRAPIVEGDNRLSLLHRAQDDFKVKGLVGQPVAVPDSKWREAAV